MMKVAHCLCGEEFSEKSQNLKAENDETLSLESNENTRLKSN